MHPSPLSGSPPGPRRTTAAVHTTPLLLALLTLLPAAGVAQEESVPPDLTSVSPLFKDQEILNVRLEADFDELGGDRGQETPERPAVFTLRQPDGTETSFEIQVRTRGNFRLQRRNCDFPPLRLNFRTGDVEGTILDGQDKVKLVTHCKDRDRYLQNVVKEYLVYRIYNVLTPLSMQARMVRMEYVDTSGREEPLERLAILLEPEEDLAERLGGEVMPDSLQELGVHPARISTEHAVRVNLFEYMVGNTDFSLYGQVGSAPHNVVPVVLPNQNVLPVPYDFDWTGLVNAPYARPARSLGINRVRQRIYRGLCRAGVDYPAVYVDFLEHRAEITELLESQEGLDERVREDVVDFLEEFWETLENPRRARREIEEACRQY